MAVMGEVVKIGPGITLNPSEIDFLDVLNLTTGFVYAVADGRFVYLGHVLNDETLEALMTMGGREVVNVPYKDAVMLTEFNKCLTVSHRVDHGAVEAVVDIRARARAIYRVTGFYVATHDASTSKTTINFGRLTYENGTAVPESCKYLNSSIVEHYALAARQITEMMASVKQGFEVAELEVDPIGNVRLVLRRAGGREKMTKYAGRPRGGA